MKTIEEFLKSHSINYDDSLIESFIDDNDDKLLELWKGWDIAQKTSNTTIDEQIEDSSSDLENIEKGEASKNELSQDEIQKEHTESLPKIEDQGIAKSIDKTKSLQRIAPILPNAKESVEYSCEIPMDGVLKYDYISGLEDSGLEFTNNKIVGIPIKNGELKIKCKYKRTDWEEGRPLLDEMLNLIINPDPRSLWKDIPTSEDVEYYKPDRDSKYVKVESKKEGGFIGIGQHFVPQKDIVAASQRGRSHAHEGIPRDDDFGIEYFKESGWYCMVVADGAGSAKYSRKGSAIACDTVLNVCLEKLTDPSLLEKHILIYNKDKSESNKKAVLDIVYKILVAGAFAAYKAIEGEAINKNSVIKDYATTLEVSICKKFDFGWFVSSFWIGDGAICIYADKPQSPIIMGTPDGGEYAGQTRFLTMPEIFKDSSELFKRIRMEIIPDFTALFMMTDGVSDPMFETDANLAKNEKWNELWKNIKKEVDLSDDNEESQYQLLKWLEFWSQGNHDDRTIAILY